MSNINVDDGALKYKKKKNQSSKSIKRSDHKHIYEKIILFGFLGTPRWAKRCTICGRVKECTGSNVFEGLKHVDWNKPYISMNTFYSAKELKTIYPDIKIYAYNRDKNGEISFTDGVCEVKI